MRNWIDIVQLNEKLTLPAKPLSLVTDIDVIRALFDIDDLRNVMVNQWDLVDFGEDENGQPIYFPLPNSSKDITPSQMRVLLGTYKKSIATGRRHLESIAEMPIIPVTRRLEKLPDINNSLGIHWSYGSEANEISNFGDNVLFAEVENKYVDWTTTLCRAMFWWYEEQEISIVSGSPVKLIKIEFKEGAMIRV